MPCSCHDHDHQQNETKNLGIAFVLNFCFAIVELIGGILSNSVALLSDALHDMGDALAIAFAWLFAKIGQRKRSKSFSYGYKRFSLLSALLNSLILIIGSIFMGYLAITRLQEPAEVQSKLMFLFAILGVVVNGVAVWKVHKGKTMNEKVISLHLLEDLLGWCVILIGSVVIYFTGWHILDPILALGISVWIFFHGVRSGSKATHLFLQGVPNDVDDTALLYALQSEKAVSEIHDLHIWSLDGANNIGSCHVVVKEEQWQNQKEIKNRIRELFSSHNVGHVTLELELVGEVCELREC